MQIGMQIGLPSSTKLMLDGLHVKIEENHRSWLKFKTTNDL